MSRFFAAWADLVLVAAIGTVPEGLGFVQPAEVHAWAWWWWTLVFAAGVLTIPFHATTGATFGKAVAGVRAVLPDGSAMGWNRAAVRWSVAWGLPAALSVLVPAGLPVSAVLLPWAVSIGISALREDGRTLHDLAVGTIVTDSPKSPMLRGSAVVDGLQILPLRQWWG